MRTILIIESEELTYRFIEFLLQKDDFRVVTSASFRRALALIRSETPDLVILDLVGRGDRGLETCHALRARYGEALLVLSDRDDEQAVIEFLDAGADAYVTVPFRPHELVARIRALLRRRPAASQNRNIIRTGEIDLDLEQRRVLIAGKEVRLTRTEFNIFACLARHHDSPLSTQTIVENVWGAARTNYTQALRVHIGHIRRKIEPRPERPRYLITQRGGTYCLTGMPGDSR